MSGIYVVMTPVSIVEPGDTRMDRVVVVAPNANRAVTYAVEALVVTPGEVRAEFCRRSVVGRIGAYEPGIEGAHLTAHSSVIAIQRAAH